MKKFLTSAVTAATFLAAVVPVANAAVVASTFNVSVALTAICTATNLTAPTLGFGSYTAFQTAANTGSVGLTFQCTRGLTAPTFSFDTTGTDRTGTGVVGYGVLAGLNYSLAVTNSAITTAGTAATAASGSVGSADVRTVTVTGTMAAGQAGDCATSTAAACAATATHIRTLTVTY